MKKIFTLLLAVSFLSSLSAQTYCEDFEGLLLEILLVQVLLSGPHGQQT